MFEILKRVQLSEEIFWLDVLAPRVAMAAKPGQFVIVKDNKFGERIPLTICDYNREIGSVSVVVQTIGNATKKLAKYQKGDFLEDFAGPLGNASEFMLETQEETASIRRLFIAGGLGAAPVYPQAKWLTQHGASCDVIIGARSKNILIMEEEISKVCDNLYVCTDDGSYGFNGNVTVLLKDLVENRGKKYDEVIAIGPMVMMKFVALTTKQLGIKTVVSMNPIMVDGTGMCGACRISVDGKTKFACVDGPEFDGHLVNFDEAIMRLSLFQTPAGRERFGGNNSRTKACRWLHFPPR